MHSMLAELCSLHAGAVIACPSAPGSRHPARAEFSPSYAQRPARCHEIHRWEEAAIGMQRRQRRFRDTRGGPQAPSACRLLTPTWPRSPLHTNSHTPVQTLGPTCSMQCTVGSTMARRGATLPIWIPCCSEPLMRVRAPTPAPAARLPTSLPGCLQRGHLCSVHGWLPACLGAVLPHIPALPRSLPCCRH